MMKIEKLKSKIILYFFGVVPMFFLFLLIGGTDSTYATFSTTVPLNQQIAQQQTILEMTKEWGGQGSLLAKRNDAIITDRGLGYQSNLLLHKNDEQTLYNIASMQKMITGVMLLRVLKEHHIPLRTRLSTFYPNIPGSSQITLQAMLSMTSGLHRIYQGSGSAMTKAELLDFLTHQVRFSHYGRYEYSPVNYSFLAFILEKVSQKSYEANFDLYFRKPLGLKQTIFADDMLSNNPHLAWAYLQEQSGSHDLYLDSPSSAELSFEFGTGNLYSTTLEMEKIIQAVMQGRIIQDRRFNSYFATKHRYFSGMYRKKDYIMLHGMENSYETTIQVSYDGNQSLFFFSNVKRLELLNRQLLPLIWKRIF